MSEPNQSPPLSDELAQWERNLWVFLPESEYAPSDTEVSLRLTINTEETGATGEALRERLFRNLKKVLERGLPPQILEISSLGGACPTQAEGYLWGKPFYFRARHGEWSISVAETYEEAVRANGTAVDFTGHVYCVNGGEDDSGGYMENEDVLKILWDTAMATRSDYANWKPKR